jgi:alkylation response protein AidB-like acyl-CoA dehydrogenase
MVFNSVHVTLPTGTSLGSSGERSMLDVARAAGRADEPHARELVGEAQVLELVGDALGRRIGHGIQHGTMPEHAAGIGRLVLGIAAARRTSIAFELAGAAGAAWLDEDDALAAAGEQLLMRQVSCIAGGTTEMARNMIAERVLGMERERTLDRNVAFRDVPRSPSHS